MNQSWPDICLNWQDNIQAEYKVEVIFYYTISKDSFSNNLAAAFIWLMLLAYIFELFDMINIAANWGSMAGGPGTVGVKEFGRRSWNSWG